MSNERFSFYNKTPRRHEDSSIIIPGQRQSSPFSTQRRRGRYEDHLAASYKGKRKYEEMNTPDPNPHLYGHREHSPLSTPLQQPRTNYHNNHHPFDPFNPFTPFDQINEDNQISNHTHSHPHNKTQSTYTHNR
jgi:hypothetical protein